MTDKQRLEIESKLRFLLKEIEQQHNVSVAYPADGLSFADEMSQIHEYIEVAGEYGLAYEYMVASLEDKPFVLSGKAAIKLLELGLFLGYKSTRKEDSCFDRR